MYQRWAHHLSLHCHAGVDDTLALMLCLSDPASKLLAVSSVFGNTDAPQVAINTSRVLTLCERSEIPTYVGANEPLIRPKPESPRWFGGGCHVHNVGTTYA